MITAKKLRRKAAFMESDENFKFILAKLEECDATAYELKIPLSSLPEPYSDYTIQHYGYALGDLGFQILNHPLKDSNGNLIPPFLYVSWME